MVEVTSAATETSSDEIFVETICDLVNRAYEQAKRGLWRPGLHRTTTAHTATAIASNELVVARLEGRLVGAVRTTTTGDTGWFGMLAVDPTDAGQGIGNALVAHVQGRAAGARCVRMQLELLAPSIGHPHTDRLARWYHSLGYRPTARQRFALVDPEAAAFLLQPCDVVVCHKPLTPD